VPNFMAQDDPAVVAAIDLVRWELSLRSWRGGNSRRGAQ
jgi:hypothetical protein